MLKTLNSVQVRFNNHPYIVTEHNLCEIEPGIQLWAIINAFIINLIKAKINIRTYKDSYLLQITIKC